jgi:hypothetical protein
MLGAPSVFPRYPYRYTLGISDRGRGYLSPIVLTNSGCPYGSQYATATAVLIAATTTAMPISSELTGLLSRGSGQRRGIRAAPVSRVSACD